MSDPTGERYAFGPFLVIADEGVLLRDGQPVALAPKVFATLVALLRRHGRIVTREALVAEVWPDTFVEDGNLTQNISTLRKVLGDDASGRPYLDTVPRRGYRFSAAVMSGDAANVRKGDGTVRVGTARWKVAAAAAVVLAASAVPVWRARAPIDPRRPDAVHSLAVLPFASLPPGDDYLGVGIADTLMARLSAMPALLVKPTAGVARFRDAGEDAPALGRRLAVDAVLDGRVQRTGDRLRVTTHLLRARDGALLWSASFDGRFDDIFRVQDDIADQVAVAVLGASRAPGERSARRFTPRPEAYEAYMRARYFASQRTREGARKAVDNFERAIALEPAYALAYAGAADAYRLGGDYIALRAQLMPRAKEAAERAVQLDDHLAEAHVAKGQVDFDAWDWPGAEREFTRALELNPNLADSHGWYGQVLLTRHRFDEALRTLERAHALDPLSLRMTAGIDWALLNLNRAQEAIRVSEQALQLDPEYSLTHSMLCVAYDAQRRFSDALRECSKAVESLEYGSTLADLAYEYARAGDTARAREIVERLVREPRESGGGNSGDLAVVYAALGDEARALAALEQAVAEHAERLPDAITDPRLKPLRVHPRFAALLRRMNLAP